MVSPPPEARGRFRFDSGWPVDDMIPDMLKQDSYFKEYAGRHGSVIAVLRFLEFGHLGPEDLRLLSQGFADLAKRLMDQLPDDPELTKILDNLRTAKDRAVGLAAVSR